MTQTIQTERQIRAAARKILALAIGGKKCLSCNRYKCGEFFVKKDGNKTVLCATCRQEKARADEMRARVNELEHLGVRLLPS